MKQRVDVGSHVIFVDGRGQRRTALVTAVHGENWFEGQSAPAINVVFVTDDETRSDAWGRQIERDGSVVHESNQSAHGQFWKLP